MMLFVCGTLATIQTGCNHCLSAHPVFTPARYFALLVFLLLQWQDTHAQAPGPYTVTRVEEQSVVYLFPDSISALLIHEQIALLPHTKRDSLVIQVYSNSDVRTTVFHHSDSRFEFWMTRPYKSVIDKKNVKLYDQSGALMVNKAHSSMYKSNYTTLKTYLADEDVEIIPVYTQLTNSLKSNLMTNGFVMTNMGGGTYRFMKDSVEVYFNNTRKFNEVRLKHADGTLKYALKRDYTINSFGQTVPAFEQERYKDTRFPDGCVEVVVTTKYPVYQRTAGTGRYEEVDAADLTVEAALQIYPNPASAQCVIEFAPVLTDAELEVFSSAGHEMLRIDIPMHTTEHAIDMHTWTSGTYYVRLVADEQVFTAVFIKSE